MTAKIIQFTGITTLDLPPDQILEKAIGQLGGVLVIGLDHDGKPYAASSYADPCINLWLLEKCKQSVMES